MTFATSFTAKGSYWIRSIPYVTSKDKTVALLGVKDLIIINEYNSLLICHKSRAQEIKKVVQALNDKGFDHVL